MNLPPHAARCVCLQTGSLHPICWEDNGFQEKGKQVKLRAQPGETVKAVVVDGCLLSGKKRKKCDGLFVLKKKNQRIYIVLVELKGTHIEDAFAQLISVKQCQEYQSIVECYAKTSRPIERSFIVTDQVLPLSQQDKVRGVRILASQKTKANAPDLRKHL